MSDDNKRASAIYGFLSPPEELKQPVSYSPSRSSRKSRAATLFSTIFLVLLALGLLANPQQQIRSRPSVTGSLARNNQLSSSTDKSPLPSRGTNTAGSIINQMLPGAGSRFRRSVPKLPGKQRSRRNRGRFVRVRSRNPRRSDSTAPTPNDKLRSSAEEEIKEEVKHVELDNIHPSSKESEGNFLSEASAASHSHDSGKRRLPSKDRVKRNEIQCTGRPGNATFWVSDVINWALNDISRLDLIGFSYVCHRGEVVQYANHKPVQVLRQIQSKKHNGSSSDTIDIF